MPYKYIGILLLCLLFYKVLGVWVNSGRIKKKKPKLPGYGYTLIYSDTKSEKVSSNILYSRDYDLRGKPDYIFSKGSKLIPVELKSGKIGGSATPREGDLMQLAAYFLIIESAYNIVPKYGLLIYKDYMFKIKNTKAIRNEVFYIIEEMRNMLDGEYVEANSSYPVCRYCICRGTVCEFCDSNVCK